jgi:hypothetical protein
MKSKFNQLHRIFWVLSALTTKTTVVWFVRPWGLIGGTNISQVIAVSILDPEAGVSKFLRSCGKSLGISVLKDTRLYWSALHVCRRSCRIDRRTSRYEHERDSLSLRPKEFSIFWCHLRQYSIHVSSPYVLIFLCVSETAFCTAEKHNFFNSQQHKYGKMFFLECYDNLVKSVNFASMKSFSFRSAALSLFNILGRKTF